MNVQLILIKKYLVLMVAFILLFPVCPFGQIEHIASDKIGKSYRVSTSDIRYENSLTGQIPCNPNTFWVNRSDSIIEYSLINSVVSPTGFNYLLNGGYSLAFANNNSPTASFSPTFYSTILGTGAIWVFAGNSWSFVFSSIGISFYGCSGFGNSVYLDGSIVPSGYNCRLYRYTNGMLNTVYTCPAGSSINVADEAVDALGNVYLFTGPVSTGLVDTLIVFSSAGNILNKYPIAFNSSNGYGSFILGDTLYVGFGSSNPVYSSSLVPVVFNQSTASLGTPIPFTAPGLGFYDMESCNRGIPVGITDEINSFQNLKLYPNPAFKSMLIQIPKSAKRSMLDVCLISIHGKQIQTKFTYAGYENIQLLLEDLSPGLYFVKLISETNSYYGKFEHICY